MLIKFWTFFFQENIYHDFIQKLKTLLLTNSFNDFNNSRISRLICFLCCSTKDMKLILTIIYDIIYSKTRNFPLIFSIFARIWPTCLEYQEDEIKPIIFAIMYLTRIEIINLEIQQKQQHNKTRGGEETRWKYFIILYERLCNWRVKFSSSSEVYSYLLPTLKSNSIFENDQQLSNKATEYLMAYQLLCKYEGWKWTVDVFIKQFIGDILSKWADEKQNAGKSEGFQVDDNIVAFNLYLQGHLIALLCPHEERQQAVDAIKTFSFFIKEHNFTFCSLLIQCTAIECLLLLVPRDPVLCFTEIQMWLKPNKIIPELLKVKIRSTYNIFKNRLPSYMIVSV
jgi:hypothetical protein